MDIYVIYVTIVFINILIYSTNYEINQLSAHYRQSLNQKYFIIPHSKLLPNLQLNMFPATTKYTC